jgi:hypothetical protein
MALDLPAQVLGHHVDRVQHLGRSLPGAQRRPLQVERRLDHLAVRDAGVLLLGQLDLEHRVLRNLPANPLEALLNVAAKLVRHFRVSPPNLDPHTPSSRWVAGDHQSYAAPDSAPRRFREGIDAARVTATPATIPHREPPRNRQRVAPVVITSSTSTVRGGTGDTARTGEVGEASDRRRPT